MALLLRTIAAAVLCEKERKTTRTNIHRLKLDIPFSTGNVSEQNSYDNDQHKLTSNRVPNWFLPLKSGLSAFCNAVSRMEWYTRGTHGVVATFEQDGS